MAAEIAAFSLAALVITLTPGADMALVARRAVADGWHTAARTSLGVVSGLVVHAAAAAIGVSAILAHSAAAFTALKLVGAAYLAVLGLLAFRSARRVRDGEPPGRHRGRPFVQGFLNNVLNPKVAMFYLAFLPQFIRPGDPVALLAAIMVAIHITMGIVWLFVWAWLVSRARGIFLRPRWRAAMERVTGTVFLAFGVRLATLSR
jgi:threonine/homoserine/homoserine lactone efflux protein